MRACCWILTACLGLAALGAVNAEPPSPASSGPSWRRAWTYSAGAPLTGAPVPLDGGWLVTAAKGRLAALGPDGRPLWTAAFSNMNIAGSAAVAGDVIVVADAEGWTMGLARETGASLWTTNAAIKVRHGPAAFKRNGAWLVIVLATEDGAMRCLDAKSGREVWRSEPTNRCDGPPSADGQVVAYGNCDSAIYVFDAATGAPLAKVRVGDEAQMAGGVLLLDGRVCGGTRAGELVCADVARRTVAWRAAVAGADAFVTPVAGRGVVIMGTAEGTVAAFEAKSGTERWRKSVTNAVSAVCVANGGVFAAAGGDLVGLRVTDGVPFYKLPVGDEIVGPAWNGRTLLVADDGGEVTALTSE